MHHSSVFHTTSYAVVQEFPFNSPCFFTPSTLDLNVAESSFPAGTYLTQFVYYKWVSFTLCRTFHTEVWQHPPPPTWYMDAASLLPHWLQRRWNDDLQISDRVQPLAIRKARTHPRAHTHTAHWFRRLCGFIRTRWTNKECLRLLMRSFGMWAEKPL